MRDLPPNSTVPWQVSCPFCSLTVGIDSLTSGLYLIVPNFAHQPCHHLCSEPRVYYCRELSALQASSRLEATAD
jgi:hypothetical protein